MPEVDYFDYGMPEILPEDEEFTGSGFQIPKRNTDTKPLEAAIDRRAAVISQRPAEPKPKWWQRLAAGAAGGLAGYANSSGRMRPIDVAPLTEQILYPGYRRKLSDWASQVEEAEAGVKGEREKLETLEGIRRLNAEEELRRRQMAAADAQLERARRPAKQEPTFDEKYQQAKARGATHEQALIFASGGHIPATREERSQRAPGHWVEGPDGTVRYLEAAPGQPNVFPKVGKGRPPKEPRQTDPALTEMREARLEEMDRKAWEDIEQKKVTEERSITESRTREIANALAGLRFRTEGEVLQTAADASLSVPERQQAERAKQIIAGINRKYAPKLQSAQDRYAQRIRARGGTAEEFVVDPNTLEYRRRGAAPQGARPREAAPVAPPTTQRVMPRSRLPEVVAAAAAKGITVTPQQAEAQLRREGWTIQ